MVETIRLTQGQEASVTEKDPALKHVAVGLGWDVRQVDNEFSGDDKQADYDLDASAFLLNNFGRIRHEKDFVFYNNMRCDEGCVALTKDNQTGVGEGDDEIIEVELKEVPFDITRIAFAASIHNAIDRQQNFGMIENAFIRVVNKETDVEIVRYDLSGDFSAFNAIILGELYRVGSDWVFIAKGEGYKGALGEVARSFDVNVRGE
ncbi:MAG: chemical-damaging agent resistance protein C [Rickettsiales bacterium]|nr:chemical-damaging agent resistance protein C [Rickettsiales bacterium]|tara:strand:+ start:762 stop:1376 length:615 start_codon:yes stop_codon:yes gene_type:complete